MPIYITLAQILGIIFTVAGLSFMLNKKGVRALLETKNDSFLWLYGFIALTFGAVILALNDSWNSGLVSLITLMGWLSIVKGIALTFFPESAASMYRKVVSSGFLTFSGLVALVLGIFFLYKGF